MLRGTQNLQAEHLAAWMRAGVLSMRPTPNPSENSADTGDVQRVRGREPQDPCCNQGSEGLQIGHLGPRVTREPGKGSLFPFSH